MVKYDLKSERTRTALEYERNLTWRKVGENSLILTEKLTNKTWLWKIRDKKNGQICFENWEIWNCASGAPEHNWYTTDTYYLSHELLIRPLVTISIPNYKFIFTTY